MPHNSDKHYIQNTVFLHIRRITLCLAAFFMVVSCFIVNQEVEYMRQSVSELQEKVAAFNEELTYLQTCVEEIQSSGYAVSVTPVTQDGQEMMSITFKDGRTVVVGSGRHGIDGTTDGCLMSVKEEDGVWYWTIAGKWVMLPDGSRAIAVGKDGHVGITPLMRIVDGWWEVSIDDGETWERIIESKGKDGFTVFVGLDNTHEEYIELTLYDGQVLRIPRLIPVEINLNLHNDKCLISGGETLSVPYDLTGIVPDDMFLTAGSDGKYKVFIKQENRTKGKLVVTAPDEYADGYIFMMADDRDGNSFVKVVEFAQRKIDWFGDPTYNIGAAGGSLDIPFQANFECELAILESNAEWISNIGSATSANKFTLSVKPNRSDKIRVGLVNVCPADNPDFTVAMLTIVQAGGGSMIDRPSIEVDSDGGEFRVKLFSADGISLMPLDDDVALWLETSLSYAGEDGWYLDIIVHKNRQYEGRTAELVLYNSMGTEKLGTISIYQKPWSAERKNDFILTARANMADDFTIYIPLRGNVDCLVDWGDGTSDRIARWLDGDDWIYHRYDTESPRDYTISVSGSVERLDSNGIPLNYGITSIEQWGRLGLRSMDYAFYDYSKLSFLPPDLEGSFKEVESFHEAFANCSSLTDVSPDLFSESRMATSFYGVFRGCAGLTKIPTGLFEKCKSAMDFSQAFFNCSNLRAIPKNLFSGCERLYSVNYTFYGCSSIKNIPGELFSSCPELLYLSYAFAYTGVEFVPEGLFRANTKITDFSGCFSGCPLKDILGNMFETNKEVVTFSRCFQNCKLKTIPANLFDNNRKVTNFSNTFRNNYQYMADDNTVIASESPYTIINGKKVHLYERKDYPDYFVFPSNYTRCFHSQQCFIDTIPEEWL